MVIARYERVQWVEEDLTDSGRGAGGFGSSGR
jgi:dUTPase